MRWHAQQAAGTTQESPPLTPAPPLPFDLGSAFVQTFDTPGFAGMTFYEINAKSVLNRVASTSEVPFEWTVNPYRGCGHACVYCLAGDTPVLMADGSTRPIAQLRVGDRIYGTVRFGSHRRYAVTEVLDHWTTTKPAYRVGLADGTEFTASRDHRFLTTKGWRRAAVGGQLTGFGKKPPMGMLEGVSVESCEGLEIVDVQPLGSRQTLYDITTGTGDFIAAGVVSHNCFARNTHTYLDLDAGHDFDSRVVVKVNAGQVLRRELGNPRWTGAPIAMGTNVDCYQRAEGRYRLMPEILAALRDFANPFSILTKGTLILRDLDLLRQAASVTTVRLAVSVGSTDERLWRSAEPGTPSPQRRLDVVRRLSDAGFAVSVLMAPILPGLSDSEEAVDATVRAIVAAGAVQVTPLPLHLRTGAKEWYAQWIGREHPELLPLYRNLFGQRSQMAKDYQRIITNRVRAAIHRHGLVAPERPFRAIEAEAAAQAAEAARPEQLTLL
ncbi:Rv2578c family radical SAM protein [Hamadaea tsunoensis]|uniref:Rv2578c family radical SAM protein n=1 Tax=Hamadaea tsunoensis TaxID=53368 RepID=UPI000487A3DF|nr:Rv2578c family radical SAM protein [Hamadaea tsunoensis]